MKLVIAVLTGMLLVPSARANAAPADCEAERCLIQATIDAECPCAEAKNHGRYTSCVAHVVNAAAHDGTISRSCRGKINGCFIRSTCGKREGSVSCQLPGANGRCRPLSSESSCTKKHGTVVETCCETCGGPVPTVTPTEEATATPIEATATPAGATATTTTPTPSEPVATPTETASPGEGTATPGEATATPGEATATPGEGTATPAEATATPAEATATPVEGTATPGEATATPAEPTATPSEGVVATATATEETAVPTPSSTPSEGVGPTDTATEAVPTPSATASPTSSCGNNTIDPGEFCDPPGSQCPNAGAGFTCSLTCTCDCPTTINFVGDATDAASVLDTGWTGIAHRAPVITNGAVSVAVACTGTRPCGTCPISGPIPNADPTQLRNQRCSNDTSIQCTDDTPCTAGGGTCEFFFGSNLPLAAGGVTTCVVNQFNGPLSGTANIETGEANTNALLTSRVYNGIAIDNPCPRCVGDPTDNDGTQGGKCDGGTRVNLDCDANGSIPNRADFGSTSLDCPPSPGALIATLPIDLSSATDPVTKTLSAASPGCSGEPGERCLCDTCNNLAATPCDDNSDCTAVGASICGGRRCIGGTNAGAPCANNTVCPNAGICGRTGEPTKPSACLDDTSTVGALDCDDADGNGEGQCTSGPITQSCSVASGHAQRGCTADADCGGVAGSCESTNRACFLTGGFSGKNGTNTLVAEGMEDTPMNDESHPTLGAVFCVGPTGLSSVNNVAGLPGPGRVTIRGTAVGLP